MIHFDFTPGDYVVNPKQKDWGIGQVQSIINNKVTKMTNSGYPATFNYTIIKAVIMVVVFLP